MLKSIYGFLFANQDQDQAKRHVPTIDQVFSGEDVKKTSPPVQAQLVDQRVDQCTEESCLPASTQVESIKPIQPVQTLVWSTSEKKWVENNSLEVEIVNAKIIEKSETTLAIKPVENIEEFRSNIKEHIVVQKQLQQEKQQELAKNEQPKRDLVQWIPNDELIVAYDQATEAVGKVPNLLKKIKQYQEKIASKQEAVDKIRNKEGGLNPYDRFELIEYHRDIVVEEAKIAEIELQLQHAQRYIDDPVFEEFALYLVDAENYIKQAELSGIMNANDILTSQSIYIKTKALTDQLKYGKKNPVLTEKLQCISQSFNLGEIHENSRGKNLREFSNFFIGDKTENPLYLFDRMDAKAIGESSTMRSITSGTAGGMVDNSLIMQKIQDQQDQQIDQVLESNDSDLTPANV